VSARPDFRVFVVLLSLTVGLKLML
jgi:hypothetical protein